MPGALKRFDGQFDFIARSTRRSIGPSQKYFKLLVNWLRNWIRWMGPVRVDWLIQNQIHDLIMHLVHLIRDCLLERYFQCR